MTAHAAFSAALAELRRTAPSLSDTEVREWLQALAALLSDVAAVERRLRTVLRERKIADQLGALGCTNITSGTIYQQVFARDEHGLPVVTVCTVNGCAPLRPAQRLHELGPGPAVEFRTPQGKRWWRPDDPRAKSFYEIAAWRLAAPAEPVAAAAKEDGAAP